METTVENCGFRVSQNGGHYNKDHGILGSVFVSPCSGKLPLRVLEGFVLEAGCSAYVSSSLSSLEGDYKGDYIGITIEVI